MLQEDGMLCVVLCPKQGLCPAVAENRPIMVVVVVNRICIHTAIDCVSTNKFAYGLSSIQYTFNSVSRREKPSRR